MIDGIKKICSDMLSETVFSDAVIGVVESVNPLTVKVSDKIILNEEQIVLSRNAVNFTAEINESPLFPEDPSNDTDFANRKKVIVYNSLKKGEKVIMAKVSGGQLYFVIDREGE